MDMASRLPHGIPPLSSMVTMPWFWSLASFALVLILAGLMVHATRCSRSALSVSRRMLYRKLSRAYVFATLAAFVLWAFVVIAHALKW